MQSFFSYPLAFALLQWAVATHAEGLVVVKAAKADTSAPLSQLAVSRVRSQAPRGYREVNPLGLPPFPKVVKGNAAAATNIARGPDVGLAPAPPPFVNWEGVSNVDGVAHPDTQGDVGKNHYVQWVNLSLQIFDKSTGAIVLGPVPGSSLWSGFGGGCETDNDGDPIVLYDHLADRWVFSQFAIAADGHQCLAISTTGDPAGPYHRYDFVLTPGGLNDYPKFGVWPSGYLYSANEFSPSFVDVLIGSFDREKMLEGDPAATFIGFRLLPGATTFPFAVEPANLEGLTAPPAGRPGLFVQPADSQVWGGSADRYDLWSLDVDYDTPAASSVTLTEVSTVAFDSTVCFLFSSCIPQPGTTQGLASLSQFTMYRPVYRSFETHETLLVNHTVDGGGGVAGIRWAEIRDPFGAPSVFQTGTHSPDNQHRWMGSLAMDGDGNVLLGYSLSSETTFPSIAYAGRSSTDPAGTLPQTESILMGGSAAQAGTSRWADYSTMSVDEWGDPSLGVPPDCAFWYTSEYVQSPGSFNWRTRIGAIQFPDCGADQVTSVSLEVNGQHPPSDVVSTSGSVLLTLDMLPGVETRTLDWYFAILVDGQVFWVTSLGLSTIQEAVLSAPPANLNAAPLVNTTLPGGTVITFAFFLGFGEEILAMDFITAVVE